VIKVDVDVEDVAVGVINAFIGSVCKFGRSDEAHRISNPNAVEEAEEFTFIHRPDPDDAHAY
jgi:hypothetical protein